MDYRVLRAERPEAALDAARRRARRARDQRPADARDDGHRVPGREPGGLARGGPRAADRLHRRRRADGVHQRGQYLPLHPEAMGPHRAGLRPSAAAWSAIGSPPSASSSCATWRAKNADLEATLADLRATRAGVSREAAAAGPAAALRLAPARRDGARRPGRCSTGPGTGARPPCSSPTSAATRASSRSTPGPGRHPAARRILSAR